MTTTPGARSPSSASVYHKFTGRQGQFAMTFYLGSPGGKIANGPKLISPNARSCCGGSCGTDGGLDGAAATWGCDQRTKAGSPVSGTFLSSLPGTDIVLPNLVEQRLVADVQLGGRPFAVPGGFFQHLGDDFHLGAILQIAVHFFEVGRGLRLLFFHAHHDSGLGITGSVLLQFGDGGRLISQHQVALDEIFQLADVAGPGIVLARLHKLRSEE